MTEALYRLVYHSRNRIVGSAGELDQAVREILSVARLNNARKGVTGALMFNSACFVQIMEGTRASVETLFERVQRDDRHDEVSLLSLEPIAERAFSNWSMAFVGARELETAPHDAIAKESGYDPSRISGQAVFEFLHRLVQEQELDLCL